MSRAWPTMAEVADAVAGELRTGNVDMAHRLLMDGVNRLPRRGAGSAVVDG